MQGNDEMIGKFTQYISQGESARPSLHKRRPTLAMNAIYPRQSYRNLVGTRYIHLEASENVHYMKVISCINAMNSFYSE